MELTNYFIPYFRAREIIKIINTSKIYSLTFFCLIIHKKKKKKQWYKNEGHKTLKSILFVYMLLLPLIL
jgi:hypothetical protein